jgi:DNA modification methylase
MAEKTKRQMVYDDGILAVEHGTAVSVGLPDDSVACIVTAPPTNKGVDYDVHDDNMTWDAYEELAELSSKEMHRVIIDGGRVWMTLNPFVTETIKDETGTHKNRVHVAGIWHNSLLNAGFNLWDEIVCVSKKKSGTAWGSWESPSGPHLRSEYTTILVASKGNWNRTAPEGFVGWRDHGGQWAELCRNVWRIPIEHPNDFHPAPSSMEATKRAIRLSTWPGEMVLDPFCGSGTTLAAAKSLSRRSYGIDCSKKYGVFAANRANQTILE